MKQNNTTAHTTFYNQNSHHHNPKVTAARQTHTALVWPSWGIERRAVAVVALLPVGLSERPHHSFITLKRVRLLPFIPRSAQYTKLTTARG